MPITRLLRPLAIACAALFALGCAEPEPAELLARARAAHTVEVLSLEVWDTAEQPGGELREEADPKADSDAAEPAAEDGDGDARLAIASLRVTENLSPLALDCLTVDVVFLDGAEPPAELGRERIELAIDGIADVGGTIEVSRRLMLAPGTVAVDVRLAELTAESMATLCEARALDGRD